jgi:hypothetical protein
MAFGPGIGCANSGWRWQGCAGGDPSAVVLRSRPEGKVALVAAVLPALVKDKKMSARKFVGELAQIGGASRGRACPH